MKGLGRLDEAVAWTVLAESMSNDPIIGQAAIPVYVEFGDTDRVLSFMENFPVDHPLFPVGRIFLLFMENDYQGTLDAFENIELVSDMQAEFVYPLMSLAALALEDFDTASDYLIRAKPNLDSDTNLVVDKYNLREAIMLAYILRIGLHQFQFLLFHHK